MKAVLFGRNFTRARWRAAAQSEALPQAAPLAVAIGGEQIVLWRAADGRPVAFADRCVHMPLPLSTGRCEAGRLRCRHHGLDYAPDGKVVGAYGQFYGDARRVKTYPAAEAKGRVWVWMGEPQDADESLIGRFTWAGLLASRRRTAR